MPKNNQLTFEADCKNGFTRIANLILDALPLAKLNGTQKGICLFLFRRTYGWKRKYDAISLKDFAAACGTSTTYISRQIAELLRKNIIRRLVYQPGKTPVYEFVSNLAEWDPSCIDLEKLAGNDRAGVYQCKPAGLIDNYLVVRGVNYCSGVDLEGCPDCSSLVLHKCTKDQLSDRASPNSDPAPVKSALKPDVKKDKKKVKETYLYSTDSWPFRLSELLLEKIKDHLPSFKEPDLQKWSISMERMLRLDKRPPEEVQEVIAFAQAHSFWRTNILSVDALRKHYDRLNLLRIQPPAGTGGRVPRAKNDNAKESDEYERFFH